MRDKELIKIENLSFSYGENEILNNISLAVFKGESISIVGMSGAGKSTLLKSICNLKNSNSIVSGKILLNSISNNSFLENNRGKIGFLFQTLSLLPNLTVEKNIKFPTKIIDKKNIDKNLFDNIIKMVGLENHRKKYLSELSGGMKTRVALASVYMTKPEILLLDEPFASLDVAWKYELYKKFFELKNEYKTTEIIVTHDIQESIILSNKVYILKRNGTFGKSYEINRDEINIEKLNDLKYFLKSNNETYLDIQNEILKDMEN
jgi:ABC-type nitrate/sulfonate/bicarbonate transport system ATPase subunit